MTARLLALATLLLVTGAALAAPAARPEPKEWTLLVFLNGNNNLNRFARDNLADMERVGSSDQVNVVVQWADIEYADTRRLYVTKQDSPSPDHIQSPVIQDLGKHVDMGDWRTVVDFVRWGVEHYPAKHYFIDIWDHGTGWHDLKLKDISQDDLSKHWITTAQLGEALEESARIIGHKVDVYGSDACEMAMLEIATELGGTAEIVAGSEADIPLQGWPYVSFLQKWEANPGISALDLAKLLHTEYVAFYRKLGDRHKEATFSIFDMSQLPRMLEAVSGLGRALSTLGGVNQKKAIQALSDSQGFTIDYIDLLDFADKLAAAKLEGFETRALTSVQDASSRFIVANGTTRYYEGKARGVSIWIPPWRKFYDKYVGLYKKLKFSQLTRWEEGILPLTRK